MKTGSRRVYHYGIFTALMVFFAVFMIWPIALTVRGGFVDGDGRFTFYYVLNVFNNPVLVEGLVNSLVIAVLTTGLCLVITLPLAVWAGRYEFTGKGIVTGLMLVPLILPPFVGAIGLRAILGRFGALNALLVAWGLGDWSQPMDWLGGDWLPDVWPVRLLDAKMMSVVVMEVLHLYPILFLNIVAAIANLDPTLDEAAQNLGAGRWMRFRKVTIPLIAPGLFAGGTIVFIWSFTELGTPLMFDYYRVTPVQIFWGINQVQSDPQPFALVVIMLLTAVLCYGIARYVMGRHHYTTFGRAAIAQTSRRLVGWRRTVVLTAFGLLIAMALLPHVGVVLASLSTNGSWYRSVLPRVWTLGHYEQALSHELAATAIRNSLLYASIATAICLVVGVTIAYLTVRIKIKGGGLLDNLAMLPLAVPGLVLAFGYVAMTLHWPLRDSPALTKWFSVVGENPYPVGLLIIAYTVRRLPYIVRSASAGLQQVSVSLEEAALNLGASTFTSLRRIVMPLIMANLIAGAMLTFSFCMLEVSDSLMLARQKQYFPVTKAIYELFGRLGDGPHIAGALGVWGMALLSVTLIGAAVLMGKKMGAIFRV